MSGKDFPKINSISQLRQVMSECSRCPRLTAWREKISREKVQRFRSWEYWGKPVPSLGEITASLLVVGLAPAAHGGNRTGRMFTGDRSGEWLYRTLHRFGFASQPNSTERDDGLKLIGCYITAVVHCAPPANKPAPNEIANCRPFLIRELEFLHDVNVIVALGKLAFDQILRLLPAHDLEMRPSFHHGAEIELESGIRLIASYHPSQQNTFTGRLTEPMFDAIFQRARAIIGE
jgi:uracil-DNA glycosylase